MTNHHASPPRRQAVLIVADGNYIEVFADGVDVHVAKIPQAGTVGKEDLAEHDLHPNLDPVGTLGIGLLR